MGFILDSDAFHNLAQIRGEYETQKKIKLGNTASTFGKPRLFGGTDVEKRASQICFIEKMLLILRPNLSLENSHAGAESLLANLAASRMMLAVCLYIQGQITGNCTVLSGKNAFLYQLIDKHLGISDSNFLDDEEKALCFDTARALVSLPNAFDEANLKLRESGMKAFSFSEWNVFRDALIKQCSSYKPAKTGYQYPFTSITKPAFGAVFAYAGASLGFLSAEVLNKSTQVLPARYYVSAGLSGIALTIHTSNTLGVSILAPIIANRFLESFFQIGLGHVGAVTFKIIGQGVGTAVGLPLDMVWFLSLKTYTFLKEKYGHKLDNQNLSGLRIADGIFVINGVAIEIATSKDLPDAESAEQIRIEKDNRMYINGTLAGNLIKDNYLDEEVHWVSSDEAASPLTAMPS